MARSKTARKQLKVVVPGEVLGHLDDRFRNDGWEKGLQVLAGLIAFEYLPELEQKRMIRIATRATLHEVDWDKFLRRAHDRDDDIVNDKTLKAMLREIAVLDTNEESPRRAVAK